MSALEKREKLSEFILGICKKIDSEYRVENRLRQETFVGGLDTRTKIMGRNYTYIEILGPRNITTTPGRRTARGTTYKKTHGYTVNIWLRYEDADSYRNSSRKKWDEMIWKEEAGLLDQLEKLSMLGEYVTGPPEEVNSTHVQMDLQEDEKAHYLTFQIQIHD